MEYKVIKIKGEDVLALFTGTAYYFTSNFFGLLAVATEIDDKETAGERVFKIRVGNHHADGTRFSSSVILTYAKKHIRKEENKYISKNIAFIDDTGHDLAADYLTVKYIKR